MSSKVEQPWNQEKEIKQHRPAGVARFITFSVGWPRESLQHSHEPKRKEEQSRHLARMA